MSGSKGCFLQQGGRFLSLPFLVLFLSSHSSHVGDVWVSKLYLLKICTPVHAKSFRNIFCYIQSELSNYWDPPDLRLSWHSLQFSEKVRRSLRLCHKSSTVGSMFGSVGGMFWSYDFSCMLVLWLVGQKRADPSGGQAGLFLSLSLLSLQAQDFKQSRWLSMFVKLILRQFASIYLELPG